MDTLPVLPERLHVVLDRWCERSRELGRCGLEEDRGALQQAFLVCQMLRVEALDLRERIKDAERPIGPFY